MKIILSVMIVLTLAAPLLASADAGFDIWHEVNCNESGKGPCTFCDMVKVASNATDVLRNLTLLVAVVAIIAGAFLMMFSGGDPGKFSRGKSAIVNAIIGIVIALMAWAIVNTVLNIMVGENPLPWSQITC